MKSVCLITALAFTIQYGSASAGAQLSDYTSLQIIAHQDDDILFMNLDVRNMLAAGYGVVTVYITAGQA
ncbi:MAG: PIG-L family deacetylase [Planctomycetes bacterium]|nr:PIG-L family deacetylase [Planctomycetota bacterium]